jgi:hypothetical protein
MADRSSGAECAGLLRLRGKLSRWGVWSRASLLERAQIRSFPVHFRRTDTHAEIRDRNSGEMDRSGG